MKLKEIFEKPLSGEQNLLGWKNVFQSSEQLILETLGK